MMIRGQELRIGEAESGLGSKRISGMGIATEGLQRPCDQRTSGEEAQVRNPLFFKVAVFNRPFPSSLVPLFQSESKGETILMKVTLICMKMKLHTELIFI